MPYNPSGPGNLPVERIKPITAEWVGDATAGGSANIQTFLDARRFIRAKVANIAARDALSAPQDGDLVLVLDNGQGDTQLDCYRSSGSSWVTVAVEGGGTGGGGAMTTPVVVTAQGGTNNATYALPGSGAEMVWKGGAIQVPGDDYTRTGNNITFVAGNIPATGEEVVISTANSPLVGTDAATLSGASSSTSATASTVALRGTDGTLKANNHPNIGAAGAAGTVIVADQNGDVPVDAIPAGIPWANVSKTSSSLADLATRTTANLTDFPAQSAGTANEALVSNGSALSWGFPEACFVVACSDETTSITTGTAKVTFRAPFGFTIPSGRIPRASLTTASTSGNPTVDINKNGTSILGANKLSIDANEKTSVTAATATTVATSTFADNDEITIDVDVAGTGAKGLKVYIYYVRSA